MSDERLDAKIDEIAREMTEGQLPTDFRARVMDRLQSEPERSWIWRPAWVLAPIAVAAIVLVAVFVMRGPPQSVDRVAQGVRQLPGEVRREPDRRSGTEASQTAVPARPDTPYERRAVAGTAAVGRRPDATSAGGLASDLTPDPIQIESLEVEAMEAMDDAPLSVNAMESIEVPGLDVEPLEVPAIGEE